MLLRGVLEGYPDGTFRPDAVLTRAEFAKLLSLAIGIHPSVTPSSDFSDLSANHWAFPFIQSSRTESLPGYYLFRGYPDGTFRPETEIKIVEGLVAINRAKGWKAESQEMPLDSPFPDLSHYHWAYPEAIAAYTHKLVYAGLLYPEEPLPRWLVAVFLYRAIDQSATKQIVVSLSEQQLYCLEGARVVFQFPTLTGNRGWPTPMGTFQILSKTEATDMRGGIGLEEYYVKDVPWCLFFIGRMYAIHGNYWKPEEYFGHDPSWTGSHGCIGLIPEQSRDVYDWTPIGTTLVITDELMRSAEAASPPN